MRAATTEVAGQGGLDLVIGGLGILIEKSLGRHDHAVDTVTALRRLLVDKGLLDIVHPLDRPRTVERGDGFVLRCADWSNAGTKGVTVHDHGASAALR